jgi:FG-GAP-like repeat
VFAVPTGPTPGAQVTALVAGDFNGDHIPDLAAAVSGSPGLVSILLGQSDGTFVGGGTVPVGTDPVALVAADFTGAGRLDLATADAGSNTVSVLLGNGDGTFQPATLIGVGGGPDALVAADVTNHGKLDLIAADLTGGDLAVLAGNGDGTFTALPRLPLLTGSAPTGLAAGSFDGDGPADLAVTNSTPDASVLILLGPDGSIFRPFPPPRGQTVPPVPTPVSVSPLLLQDVTASVRIGVSRLFQLFGSIHVQRIRITNIGTTTLHGPLRLILSGLPRGVQLLTRTGRTRRHAPVGAPYQLVTALRISDGTFRFIPVRRLRPHQTITLFLIFSIPPEVRLVYDVQLLEGPGPL